MGWSSAPRCSPALDDDVATAAPELSKNSVAGSRFHQLELLGAGTFGVVYRARDRRTGEIVAIKCLRANSSGGHNNGRYFSAFASEVSALEKCSGHPSIVQPRASGLLGGEAFLAMEFVGPTLKHVIKHDRFRRRHTELEVRLFMRQLLAGVRRMNRLGLMHRDLKPENVLVDARGSLKICDLGLSCSMADGPPYSNPVGTPGYRAPEIILGATDYDERVDSWALGVIMAELLAGKHPFHGSSDADHLSEMLDLLGTADIKEWSGYEGRQLPGGSQPESFLRIKFPPPAEGMGIRGPPALSDAGFEVLSGLLRCNPDKRLTAAQALQHRWFKEATSTITRR
ncbi:putative cyclin-dependent kinase F-2 [Lolium rigidum]|uniref:putative cyclin-dependent kinase F-2 n=1 Tax=Lolium rigidum TaxID=89674 RepID=UPI001F5E297C|nr:putative cyclin-dependent kinase F-2 [Lolium rigidum]